MEEVETVDDIAVTIDPVEWYRAIVDERVNSNSPPHDFIPDGVVNFLAPVFRGFMLAPMGKYAGTFLTAKTEVVRDIEIFREKIANLGVPAFLYMPLYVPTQPLFRKVDEQGTIVDLDPPETLEGGWRIRYAVLGEADVVDNNGNLIN